MIFIVQNDGGETAFVTSELPTEDVLRLLRALRKVVAVVGRVDVGEVVELHRALHPNNFFEPSHPELAAVVYTDTHGWAERQDVWEACSRWLLAHLAFNWKELSGYYRPLVEYMERAAGAEPTSALLGRWGRYRRTALRRITHLDARIAQPDRTGTSYDRAERNMLAHFVALLETLHAREALDPAFLRVVEAHVGEIELRCEEEFDDEKGETA